MTVRSYQELLVWQKAMDFAQACYVLTDKFPKHQHYRLVDQLQRSAVSVPSNIAEGQGRQHTKEFLQFLSCANGSLSEAETQLILSQRLGYITVDQLQDTMALATEIGKMLNGLRAALQKRL